MSKKSWAIPVTSIIVYIIGLVYSFQTGVDLTESQIDMLKNLLYAGLIGSGGIGAAVSISKKLKA